MFNFSLVPYGRGERLVLLALLLGGARPGPAQQQPVDSVVSAARPSPDSLARARPPAAGFRPDTLLPAAATHLGQVLLLEFARQPVLLAGLPLARYAVSEAGYGREQGEFRRAQDPTRAQVARLHTEGLRDWKGWRLLGRFQFERQWHDSIRWSLAPGVAPARPYYVAAPRPGNWDNSVYRLGAAGVRGWLKGRLLTGLHLDFDAGNYARTNDPRPEVVGYQLRTGASVGYQLRADWLLALGYTYGRHTEDGRTRFGSDANQQGADTPFTQFDVLGYGFLLESRNGFFGVRGQQHTGLLSVRYAAGPGTYLLTATGGHQQENFVKSVANSLTVTNGELAELIGSYSLTTAQLHAARFHQIAPGRQRYQRLHLDWAQGQDRNNTFGLGNNYLYARQQARLEAGALRHHPAGHLTELGGSLTYRAERRADGTAAHRRQTRRAGLSLSARHYQPLPGGTWRGILGGQVGAEADAGSSLAVPAPQQNRFSRNVVFPDYAYDRQHTAWGGLALGLERPVTSTGRVRLLAEGRYLAPLTQRADAGYPTGSAPHGSRWEARLSLQVFH
ncbi:DUF6850 family outer membrane beta-barrel protein [Hymenobacter sp. UYP22]|uniref:DUF6850 family outer membrane beta-barrel protein n=1 Tax=Hymenobacter sp. UYP22 TaxID=3156348 RepID=UPI003396D7FF